MVAWYVSFVAVLACSTLARTSAHVSVESGLLGGHPPRSNKHHHVHDEERTTRGSTRRFRHGDVVARASKVDGYDRVADVGRGLSLYWRVSDDGASLDARLEYEGRAWLGLVLVDDASGRPAYDAVVGEPDRNRVRRYGRSADHRWVTADETAQRALTRTSATQTRDRTTVSFRRPVAPNKQENENVGLMLMVGERNRFGRAKETHFLTVDLTADASTKKTNTKNKNKNKKKNTKKKKNKDESKHEVETKTKQEATKDKPVPLPPPVNDAASGETPREDEEQAPPPPVEKRGGSSRGRKRAFKWITSVLGVAAVVTQVAGMAAMWREARNKRDGADDVDSRRPDRAEMIVDHEPFLAEDLYPFASTSRRRTEFVDLLEVEKNHDRHRGDRGVGSEDSSLYSTE